MITAHLSTLLLGGHMRSPDFTAAELRVLLEAAYALEMDGGPTEAPERVLNRAIEKLEQAQPPGKRLAPPPHRQP